MQTTTNFQLVPTDKLIPYANNARTHNKEQILKLRSSIREFGFINPIIIDENFNVLAGHGRLKASKEENISEVPCVFVEHFTEAQKKAYILADRVVLYCHYILHNISSDFSVMFVTFIIADIVDYIPEMR